MRDCSTFFTRPNLYQPQPPQLFQVFVVKILINSVCQRLTGVSGTGAGVSLSLLTRPLVTQRLSPVAGASRAVMWPVSSSPAGLAKWPLMPGVRARPRPRGRGCVPSGVVRIVSWGHRQPGHGALGGVARVWGASPLESGEWWRPLERAGRGVHPVYRGGSAGACGGGAGSREIVQSVSLSPLGTVTCLTCPECLSHDTWPCMWGPGLTAPCLQTRSQVTELSPELSPDTVMWRVMSKLLQIHVRVWHLSSRLTRLHCLSPRALTSSSPPRLMLVRWQERSGAGGRGGRVWPGAPAWTAPEPRWCPATDRAVWWAETVQCQSGVSGVRGVYRCTVTSGVRGSGGRPGPGALSAGP